jgi:hypothetical protein
VTGEVTLSYGTGYIKIEERRAKNDKSTWRSNQLSYPHHCGAGLEPATTRTQIEVSLIYGTFLY